MADFSIIKIAESFRIEPDGSTIKLKRVLYNVGTDGPFTLDVPETEFSAESLRAELARRASEIERLRAK